MFGWRSTKHTTPPESGPRFEHPIGAIRVSRCPDGKWRCQSYGLPIPARELYYVPEWATIVWPPGNEAGFDSEEGAVAAWEAYTQRQRQPDRILFCPKGGEGVA